MKKVTKKNLDELAKVMPVISRNRQTGYVGGTIYFDLSGNKLGTVGSSNELRVLSLSEWNDYQNAPGINTELDGSKLGISLSNASDVTKTMVATSFAQSYGFMVAQVNSNVDIGADAGIQPGSPNVLLINSNSMIFNNLDDLINTIHHEQYHLTGAVEGTSQNEIGAIEYQISQPGYISTSNDYKIKTGDYLYAQWQRQGIAGTSGYYKLDAYKKCGVII